MPKIEEDTIQVDVPLKLDVSAKFDGFLVAYDDDAEQFYAVVLDNGFKYVKPLILETAEQLIEIYENTVLANAQ